MNENLAEILLFANQNPSCWFATSEENQPHVRGMLMWFADETGFYFHTASAKNLYHQIKKNPKVEAAFIRNANDPINFESMHVSGVVEVVKDKELETRLLQERSWLQDNMNRSGVDTELVIYKIAKGTAYIWNMSWNIKESEIPRVNF